jgi:L-fuculose-phosphate aldolase
MHDHHLIEEIQQVALSMFRKNFLGVYHGSISARIDAETFLINTKEAIFDEITAESLIRLEYGNFDYRRNIASMDVDIHEEIYRHIPHAKYIAFAMPPYVTAYALQHDTFAPIDYFGNMFFDNIDVYDPEPFSDWYDRAPHAITNYFKRQPGHLMLIRGYGLYVYDRDLTEMAKKIAILENSARLMMLRA